MAGVVTKIQREQRVIAVISYIFLFRFVMVKDLNFLGCTLMNIKDMRRTIEYLLKYKLIGSFVVCTPIKTTGYYLLPAGLSRLPKSLLDYKYAFYPVWYRPGKFWHDSGVSEACLLIMKLAGKGYWISEWMIRQDRGRALGKKMVVGLSGGRKKSVSRGRLPDGFFVVCKGGRIAVEFESNRKNVHAWVDMIRDLEYGLNVKEKINPDTNEIVTGRDFEAVLFVFQDDNTFAVYQKRFVEYSRSSINMVANEGIRSESVANSRHFFLTTLDGLKKGIIFDGKEKVEIGDLFRFVEIEAEKHLAKGICL